jgi:hypothetical protein
MTLIVSAVTRGLAFVASDTRTTYRDPGGAVVDVDDLGAKVMPAGTGWVASGPSVAWREGMQRAVAGAEDLPAAIRAWAPAALGELEAARPHLAQRIRERQTTFAIGLGPAGDPWRLALDWGGADRFCGAQSHETLALCPNGSDPAVMQRLLNAYQRAIRAAVLPDVLRATAQLYRLAADHCGPHGTMSRRVGVGLVFPDGRRMLLGPVSHDELAAQADRFAEVPCVA